MRRSFETVSESTVSQRSEFKCSFKDISIMSSTGEKFNQAFELLKFAENRDGDSHGEAVEYYGNALICFLEAYAGLDNEKSRKLVKNQVNAIYKETLDSAKISKMNMSKILEKILRTVRSIN